MDFSGAILVNLDIPAPSFPPDKDGQFFSPSNDHGQYLFYQKNYPGRSFEISFGYRYNNNKNAIKFSFYNGRYKAHYRFQEMAGTYRINIDQTLIDRLIRYKISHITYFLNKKFYFTIGAYWGVYYDSFWDITTSSIGRAEITEFQSSELGLSSGFAAQLLNRKNYQIFLFANLNYDISIVEFKDINTGLLIKFDL